jgi:hypothetical protein
MCCRRLRGGSYDLTVNLCLIIPVLCTGTENSTIQAIHKCQDADTSVTSNNMWMGPKHLLHYTEKAVAYLIPDACIIAVPNAQMVLECILLYLYKAYQLQAMNTMLW